MDEESLNDEALKKILFVDDKMLEEGESKKLIQAFSQFGNVSSVGRPIVKSGQTFTKKDTLKIQLILRNFANILDIKIPRGAGLEEISKWNEYTIEKNQVIARLKDITDEGFAIKTQAGYAVRVSQIKEFLSYLKARYQNNEN